MKTNEILIFIVEDDPAFNKLLTGFLTSKNIGTIKSFLSGEACLEEISQRPEIVLLDYDLPNINGLQTLREIKKLSPDSRVIFLSGQGDVKVGVDAMKEGAVDYLVKDLYAKENALFKIIELKNKEDFAPRPDDKNQSSHYF